MRIRGHSKGPNMEDFGIKEGLGIVLHEVDQGADEALRFSAGRTDEYSFPADVAEDLFFGHKLFRIRLLYLFYFPFFFRNLHWNPSFQSMPSIVSHPIC